MEQLMLVVFALGLSFLLVHEMDAIRNKEWRMFIGLRNLEEETAFRVFLILHLPLYALVLALLLSPLTIIGQYLVDIFLVVHALVHVLFHTHKENEFGTLSQVFIFGGGVCGLIHLMWLIFA